MNSTKYGTISTGSKEASLTAKQILLSGGNAFDAAVGAVFTSMCSEFALTGPFGGGTCLGMEKNKTPFIYDFFVDCPSSIKDKKEFKEISVNFGDTSQQFFIGNGSIAPPGNIKGLLMLHKDKGVLSLKEILQPAIDYSLNGVEISEHQAYIMNLIKPILNFSSNQLFNKNNKFISHGDIFTNPKFSEFLKILINDGANYFYNNQGLDEILNYLNGTSYLTKTDFKNYKVFKREPVFLELNGLTIYTNPPPSYGGSLIIFLLKLLKESNKDINLLELIKGMNLASSIRNEVCTDPNDEFQISKILDSTMFNKYLKIFQKNEDLDFFPKLDGFGSTTHVSIMDFDGNAASITTTNGEGCGEIIPQYGIMMNNMLGEKDLNPFGFHKWNKKRRLPTMISPIIITDKVEAKYVLGSGGSNRIRSANTQVILNLLFYNMSLKEAISCPRVHLEENTLFHEPGIQLPHGKLNDIKINAFDQKNLFFGGVNAVSSNEAIGDERRGGIGIVVKK